MWMKKTIFSLPQNILLCQIMAVQLILKCFGYHATRFVSLENNSL